MTELDLTDPAIREMADYNHRPEEVWNVGGGLMSVHCGACFKSWPCPTRVALRDIEANVPEEDR